MQEASESNVFTSRSRLHDRPSIPVLALSATPSTAALRIEAHTSFEAARPDWTVFQTVADCYPFQHYDWLETWHRTIGRARGVEPFVVVAKDGHGVVRAVYPSASARVAWRGCSCRSARACATTTRR
jgi:CelD/BcsL family acetyltransferase involved in cellulose biosynthesis